MAATQKPGWIRSLITFLIVFGLVGYLVWQGRSCTPQTQSARPADARMVDVTLNDVVVRAEVADTPELRRRGLSGRSNLEAGHGMLFVFPEPERPPFWMKDTTIPLSIAFITGEGRIVKIARMEPNSLRRIAPEEPVSYALEVRQGFFGEHGIEAGDTVTLPEDIPPPAPPDDGAGDAEEPDRADETDPAEQAGNGGEPREPGAAGQPDGGAETDAGAPAR